MRPDFFISLEYLNLVWAALAPTTSHRLGPTFFLPFTMEWQALHLLKTFLPFVASPAASAAPDMKIAAAVIVAIAARERVVISFSYR